MRYEPNLRASREILNSPEVAALVVECAELGAEEARRRAPVSNEDKPRHYVDTITTYPESLGDRVAAVITATAPYAAQVEQAHHVITSAVDRIEAG